MAVANDHAFVFHKIGLPARHVAFDHSTVRVTALPLIEAERADGRPTVRDDLHDAVDVSLCRFPEMHSWFAFSLVVWSFVVARPRRPIFRARQAYQVRS